MEQVFLVIGKVEKAVYLGLLEKLQTSGEEIQLRRVLPSGLYLTTGQLYKMYGTPEQNDRKNELEDDLSDSAIHEWRTLAQQLSREHLSSYGAIAAIVMDEEAWRDGSILRSSPIIQAVLEYDPCITQWMVVNGQVVNIGRPCV